MRALPALVAVVAAIVAPLASAGCYSVPQLMVDGGTDAATNPSDGSGGGSESSSSSNSGSGGSSGSGSGGPTDASTHGDAATCTGGVLCPCSNANGCTSAVCAVRGNVGSAIFMKVPSDLMAGFCTQPCCTSKDCPSGTVCWASGVGGQYCVDPTWLGRSKPASPPTLLGGSSCSTGSQCNSGLCVSGACADTCCSYSESGADCVSPASCVFSAFPGTGTQGIDSHFAAHCAPRPGSTQTGNPCNGNSNCQGGLCYPFGGSLGNECTEPCRVSSDCVSGSVCAWDVLAGSGTDVYAACFPLGMLKGYGATCASDMECASLVCNSTNCTGPCFGDGDCSGGVSGWRCTPGIVISFMTVGNYSVLSCGP